MKMMRGIALEEIDIGDAVAINHKGEVIKARANESLHVFKPEGMEEIKLPEMRYRTPYFNITKEMMDRYNKIYSNTQSTSHGQERVELSESNLFKTINKLTKNNMGCEPRTLTQGQKDTLSKDDQALLQARFVDEEFDLTSRGMGAILRHYFLANKKAIVALAKERLADMEKENTCS